MSACCTAGPTDKADQTHTTLPFKLACFYQYDQPSGIKLRASTDSTVFRANLWNKLRSSIAAAPLGPLLSVFHNYQPTHAFYWHHWWPNLPGCCCICLEQSAGVSTVRASPSLQVFLQQTEDRALCPVVQLFWLRASHCTHYHATSLLCLRVTCHCSLSTILSRDTR